MQPRNDNYSPNGGVCHPPAWEPFFPCFPGSFPYARTWANLGKHGAPRLGRERGRRGARGTEFKAVRPSVSHDWGPEGLTPHSLLWMRKLRTGGWKHLAQGHRGGSWQSWGQNTRLSPSFPRGSPLPPTKCVTEWLSEFITPTLFPECLCCVNTMLGGGLQLGNKTNSLVLP